MEVLTFTCTEVALTNHPLELERKPPEPEVVDIQKFRVDGGRCQTARLADLGAQSAEEQPGLFIPFLPSSVKPLFVAGCGVPSHLEREEVEAPHDFRGVLE